MPSNYSGTPANVVGTKLTIPEPIDADARNAAAVNTCLSPLADFTELVLEHLLALCSSNWTQRTGVIASATAIAINPVLQGAGSSTVMAVVVAGAGLIDSSPDGKTWTARTSGTANALQAVASNGSLWVAVGGTGAATSGTVTTSPDGITWTVRTSTLATTRLRTVCWSSSLSLWVAGGDTGTLFTSPDGTTWTARTSNITGTIASSAFGAGIFVVGQTTGATNQIATSTDGLTWTARTVGTNGVKALCFAAGQFVLIDATTSPPIPYTSTNGTSWTTRSWAASNVTAVGGIAHNGRHFLVSSSQRLTASIDGITWVDRPLEDLAAVTDCSLVAASTKSGMFIVADATSTARFTSLKHPAA